jgi:hypothetical protein
MDALQIGPAGSSMRRGPACLSWVTTVVHLGPLPKLDDRDGEEFLAQGAAAASAAEEPLKE